MLCRPAPAEVELPAIPEGRGARPSPLNAVRAGPGEDYDLRDYRPGDPMRSIHWKLSSKWDELIVRERAEAFVPLPLLTLDRFGPPEVLDRLLDRLKEEYGYSELDAMLVLKDILSKVWQGRRKGS